MSAKKWDFFFGVMKSQNTRERKTSLALFLLQLFQEQVKIQRRRGRRNNGRKKLLSSLIACAVVKSILGKPRLKNSACEFFRINPGLLLSHYSNLIRLRSAISIETGKKLKVQSEKLAPTPWFLVLRVGFICSSTSTTWQDQFSRYYDILQMNCDRKWIHIIFILRTFDWK